MADVEVLSAFDWGTLRSTGTSLDVVDISGDMDGSSEYLVIAHGYYAGSSTNGMSYYMRHARVDAPTSYKQAHWEPMSTTLYMPGWGAIDRGTSDGSDGAKINLYESASSTARGVDFGIMAINLDDLVENTDFWYASDFNWGAHTTTMTARASVTPTLVEGEDYLILAHAYYSVNNVTKNLEQEIALDGTRIGGFHSREGEDTNEFGTHLSVAVIQGASAGAQTIALRSRDDATGTYNQYNDSYLFVLRLGAFANHTIDGPNDNTSPTASTWNQLCTVTHTPAATGNTIVIAATSKTGGAYYSRARLQADNVDAKADYGDRIDSSDTTNVSHQVTLHAESVDTGGTTFDYDLDPSNAAVDYNDAVLVAFSVALAGGAATQNLVGAVSDTTTISGDQKQVVKPAGAVASASTAAGAIVDSIKAVGAVTSGSSLSGALTSKGQKQLAGAVTDATTLSGDIANTLELAGAVTDATTLTGALVDSIRLAGATTSASTLTGGLTADADISLAGAVTAASTVTADIVDAISLAGAVTDATALTGNLTADESLSLVGAVTSASTLAGGLTSDADINLAGAVTSGSTIAGTIETVAGGAAVGLAGAVTAASTLAGALASDVPLIGATAGGTSITGDMALAKYLIGAVTDASSITGVLSTSAAATSHDLIGAVASVSTTAGSIELGIPLVGATTAASSVSGFLTLTLPLDGAVTAASSITATLETEGGQYLTGAVTSATVTAGSINLSIRLVGATADGTAITGVLNVTARQSPGEIELTDEEVDGLFTAMTSSAATVTNSIVGGCAVTDQEV